MSTAATDGDGINALVDEVQKRHQSSARAVVRDTRQALRQLVAEAAAHQVKELIQTSDNPIVDDICDQVRQGALSFEAAAKILITITESHTQ